MSYQKCPICNGSGQSTTFSGTSINTVCPTCKGRRIINESTGLPPDIPSAVKPNHDDINTYPIPNQPQP